MTIRWGIVTSGKICHDFVNAINSFPKKGDQVIAAVAARNESRAEEFAKMHNIAKVFSSYEEMARSKDIDVAFIGALNPDHYELSKLFLQFGKHVLCEKPLCLNESQTHSLVNLARNKNLFLMEAFWCRFCPHYISLEKEIESGNLGQLQSVEVNYGLLIADMDRLSKKALGSEGSAVLYIGIYALQFVQYIFKDEPIQLSLGVEPMDNGMDLVDTIYLKYSGGRRGVINLHRKPMGCQGYSNKATVVGTKRKFTIEEPFHFAEAFTPVDGSMNRVAIEVASCINIGLTESPRMTHQDSLLLAKLRDTMRRQVGVHFDVDDKQFV